MDYIWNPDQKLEKFPLAETNLSLQYIYEILTQKRYLDFIRKESINIPQSSYAYIDTLSIFGELLFRISKEQDLKERLLSCFEAINDRNPIKDSDFVN